MKSLLFLAACIVSGTAAPSPWTLESASLSSRNSKVLESRGNEQSGLTSCDLSGVNITAYLATIPDAPAVKEPGKSRLVQVTIGRGIQNYTCADNTDSTKPKAIGAVANLYNLSCLAVNHLCVLSVATPLALQVNTTLDASGRFPWTDFDRSGHHYFNAAGSPVFDLNDDKNNQLGVIVADGKNPDMKVDAPVSAVRGQIKVAGGQTGAVPWLKLQGTNGTTNNLLQVYRVDTAGGNPPATCAGQPAVISVQYAAQYWFFASG